MRPILHLKLGIKNTPFLFRRIWPLQERSDMVRRVVRPGDDVVIEGYPRSANTFATHAFIESQGRSVRAGNHFHSPSQFTLARRWSIPAMLVLRNPLDAAISYVIFSGTMDAEEALIRYISFHRPLLPITDSFVVAPFEEVTSRFGDSIARLNDKFGTSFSGFDHTPENQKFVFDRIAEDREKRARVSGDRARDPLRTTTPTKEKEERKRHIGGMFNDPRLDDLKKQALGQYSQLLELAGSRSMAEGQPRIADV